MVVAHHGSIYETRPLQNALMTAFSDNYLFGGPRDDDTPQTKVAVTAASAAGLAPVVLSNYNRLGGHEEQRLPSITLLHFDMWLTSGRKLPFPAA